MLILTAANVNTNPACELTPRQQAVVSLIADGCQNKQIAHVLGITIKTVETHRMVAMHRAGLQTTADVVRYAIRHGLAHL